ncbi:unnamed protein product [Echinostoma caproni]|uniref:Transmembrane protein n=1 Tax=Echinostoma caproni TaxID=27848 RepID=A0A183A4W0_9TREM|nr:unnamed protein product [Echinostoma caproni]
MCERRRSSQSHVTVTCLSRQGTSRMKAYNAEEDRSESEQKLAGDLPETREPGKHESTESDVSWSYESQEPDQTTELTRLSRLSQMNLNVGFPSSYATQLIQLTAEAAQRQEKEEIEQSWQTLKKHSKLRRKSAALLSTAARAEPLLPLSNVARNALHELQLIWIMFQYTVIVVLFSKLTWNAKLRGPVDQVPKYSAYRMPSIPGQDQMNTRLLMFVILTAFLYLPACLLHFVYVLDDIPDE